MSSNCRHKSTEIIDERKALWRQIIPKTDRVRKYAADINILITSKNKRKIMHYIAITGLPSRIRNRNYFSQFRCTDTKVISIEKTKPDYISKMR